MNKSNKKYKIKGFEMFQIDTNEKFNGECLWLGNNTILLGKEKHFSLMIKYCYSKETLGIPISERKLLKKFKIIE